MIPVIIEPVEFSSNFYFIDGKLQPRSFSHKEILSLIKPAEVNEKS